MQAEQATFIMETNKPKVCSFVMYNIKKDDHLQATSSSDADDDTNLEIPKPSEVLSAINVYRHYISENSYSNKTLNSLISLQMKCMCLIQEKLKQIKLSDFLKQDEVQNNILFFCKILYVALLLQQ